MPNDDTQVSYGLSDQGAAAARLYWEKLDKAVLPRDPRKQEFANAVIETLIQCVESRSAVDKKAIEGAAKGAEQLNVKKFHGINEVIQNADDTDARKVAIRLRTVSGRRYLFVVHNGAPIQLRDLLPIVIPYLTTKDEDPDLKGKFGIGLKTCARFSDRMDVHCAPYHFRAVRQSLEQIDPAPRMPRFFDNDGTNTLFIFRLRKEFDLENFEAWLSEWDSSSLLFLTSVREFAVQTRPKRTFRFGLDVRKIIRDRSIRIRGRPHLLSASILKTRDGKQKWHRYSVSFKVPEKQKRLHKSTASETVISVAVPTHQSQGKVFAGLPTEIRYTTPLYLDAQFDPDASRERLLSTEWNKWLLRRAGDVVIEAAIELFSRGDPSSWNAVPIDGENNETTDWFIGELGLVTDAVREAVERRAQIKIGRKLYPWEKIGYCDEAVEPFLDSEDVKALASGIELLPKSRQDRHGRWRQALDDSNHAHLVSVEDALRLFELDQICSRKRPKWFVGLAYQVINEGYGFTLFDYPSVLTADGAQVQPQNRESATEILVLRSSELPIDEGEGISTRIHAIYGQHNEEAKLVTNYLQDNGNLFGAIDAFNYLLAIANKGAETPIAIDDESLIVVRDLFSKLEKSQTVELGPKLGKSLSVNAFTWEGNNKKPDTAPIGDCYLPASIEKEKSGWSIAAGKTPGLIWLSTHYAKLLASKTKKNPKNKKLGSVHRKLGARAFFHALGAETSPRLEVHQKGSWKYLRQLEAERPHSQEKVFSSFSSYPEGFLGDSQSTDLVEVLEDICATKRKKERKVRGIALFETLSKNWQRLFADHTQATAGYHYYNWKRLGRTPSTWIAHLMDHDWLVNEEGIPKRPEDLGFRNPLTLAIYGNAPGFFAADLGPEGDRMVVAKTLGIETEPGASRIVELIEQMKKSGESPDIELLNYRYSALARLCPKDTEHDNNRHNVDDLTIKKLQNRFGSKNASDGLIYANGSWVTPAVAFQGKQVFHQRRAFVTGGSEISRLWRTLGINEPNISDCIEVLNEVANDKLLATDRTLLVETYRYIESELSKPKSKTTTSLKNLPLWCGDDWQRQRPIYLVPDFRLAQQIRKFARVWAPPGNTADISTFTLSAGVVIIDVSRFPLVGINDATALDDKVLQHLFGTALGLLRDYLALNAEPAYRATKISWDKLVELKVRISPNLGIQLSLPGYKKRRVDINAHLDLKNGAVWFQDENLINTKEDGCRLISECFDTQRHKETIELAWHYCWHQAQHGHDETGVELSENQDENEDPLTNMERAAKRGSKKRSSYDRTSKSKEPKDGSKNVHKKLPPRHLKPLADLQSSSVEIQNKDNARGGHKPTKGRPLKGATHSSNTSTGEISSPTRGRKAYDNSQVEDHAIRCLHHVLTTADLGELVDLRRFRNIGADSLLDLKNFFEIKAFAGDLPSVTELTRSEFERARKERKKYYLAVITGLEEGYETVVRIYNNPVDTLDWSPSSKVVFSGFSAKRHLAITIKDLQRNKRFDDGVTF